MQLGQLLNFATENKSKSKFSLEFAEAQSHIAKFIVIGFDMW